LGVAQPAKNRARAFLATRQPAIRLTHRRGFASMGDSRSASWARLRRRLIISEPPAMNTSSRGSLAALIAAACVVALAAPAFAQSPRSSMAVTGPFADWSPAGAPLERVGEGVWTGAVELPAGATQIKLTANGSWDANWGAAPGAA